MNLKFKVSKILQKDKLNIEEVRFLLGFLDNKQAYNKLSKQLLSSDKFNEKLSVFVFYLAVRHADWNVVRALYTDIEDSNLAKAKVALGVLYAIMGKNYQAMQYFDKAFSQGSDKFLYRDIEDYLNCLNNLGFFNKYENVLIDCINKNSKDIRYRFLALIYQVNIYGLKGEAPEYLLNNLDFLTNNVNHSSQYFTLAYCAYELGYFQMAVNYYDRHYQECDLLSIGKVIKDADINVDKLFKSTHDLCQVIEKQGRKPFLIAGTLLGMEREGRPLKHDKDTDLGLFVDSYDEIKVLVYEICKDSRYIAPYMVNKPKESLEWNVPIIDTKSGISIDLFFHRRKDKLISMGIWTRNATIEWVWRKFDILQKQYGAYRFWVPDDPDIYLEKMYGNWRKEVKSWDSLVCSPNLTRTSQKAVIYYGLQRLMKGIEARNIENFDMYYDALNEWGFVFSKEAQVNLNKIRQHIVSENEY